MVGHRTAEDARTALAAILLLVPLVLAAGTLTAAQGADDPPVPLNVLNLRAEFESDAPGDAITIELIGRRFELAPRSGLGMSSLPIGTTVVHLVDIEPDLLELTDIDCSHLDGDELEWEADLESGDLRLTLDVDDAVRCTYRLRPPTSLVRIRVDGQSDVAGDIGFDIDDQDSLSVPVGTSEEVELRVRHDGSPTTIQLTDPARLLLEAIECVRTRDLGGTIETDLATRSAALALPAESQTTCTFTMAPVPLTTVIGAVETDPAFTEGKVDLEMAGVTVALGHGERAIDRRADPARYPLILIPDDAWALRSITCVDSSGMPVSFVEGDLPGAILVEPAPDETLCSFTVSATSASVSVTIATEPPFSELEVAVELGGQLVSLGHGETANDPSAPAGRYHIVLPPARDYVLSGASCSDDQGSAIDFDPGEGVDALSFDLATGVDVACTLSVILSVATVVVTVDAGVEPVETEFIVEMGTGRVALLPGEIATDSAADPELYRLAMVPVPGFRLDDIVCLDGGGERLSAEVSFENASIAFAPGIGATAICTFSVTPATATVVASVEADRIWPDTEFALELQGQTAIVPPEIPATDDAASADLYRVALVPDRRYRLFDMVCRDADGERMPADLDFENQSVSFAPGIGRRIDCTFVVQMRVATVRALVSDGAPAGTNEYLLDMNGTETRVGSDTAAIDDLADAAGYSIALLPHRGPSLSDVDCRDKAGERISSDFDPENASVAFAPGIGGDVTCSFVLGAGRVVAGVTPRMGTWSVVNRPGAVRCGGISTSLPRSTDRGRIELRRGGDRIVATGIGDSGARARIVLDRVPGEARLYRGQTRARRQGVTFTIDYEMRIVDPAHITGTLIGSFRAGGARCRLSQDFSGTFSGE